MKVLVGEFQQETNSFSNVKCDLQKFKESYYAYGRELFNELNKGTEMGGALELLLKEEVDIIPSIAMQSCSGGFVTEEAYTHFKEIFFKDMEENMPLDGIYLCLHGATVFENDEDGMGRLIEDVRRKAGDIPISVSLDFHANITKKMVNNADIIRGYQNYPHTDLYETGYDAAKLLVDIIINKIQPVMVAYKLPMIIQAEGASTFSGTMSEIAKMARSIEEEKNIVSVSYFQMQPWLDLKDVGCTIIVISNKDIELAKYYGEKLSKYYWDKKDTFKTRLLSFNDVLKMAEETEDTIVFSDSADAPSAGSAGDSTIVLKEYIEAKANYKTYITVVDPQTVKEAIEIGVGESKEFNIGGKIFSHLYSPVKIEGKVKLISDGTFTMGGDLYKDKTFSMGKAVVIQHNNLYILVMENPTIANNSPDLYLSVGLDPQKAKLVMTKSPNHFKSSFSKYTDKLILINTPGASASYFWDLPYKNIKRPVYPFDNIQEYKPCIYENNKYC